MMGLSLAYLVYSTAVESGSELEAIIYLEQLLVTSDNNLYQLIPSWLANVLQESELNSVIKEEGI